MHECMEDLHATLMYPEMLALMVAAEAVLREAVAAWDGRTRNEALIPLALAASKLRQIHGDQRRARRWAKVAAAFASPSGADCSGSARATRSRGLRRH
jgi:hypothetical protein